jgi:hypothetical protein
MDWKSVVGKIAPALGTALLGPLSGAAISVIGNALGLDEHTEESIKNALSGATPDQLLALKKADQDFEKSMAELGIKKTELAFGFDKDMEQIAASDRDSARKREISVGDKTARNLAYAITVGFFGILTALMTHSVPPESKEVLYVMLGSLGTAWTGVIAYYFGSTKHAQVTAEMLARAKPIDLDGDGVPDGVPPPANPFAK